MDALLASKTQHIGIILLLVFTGSLLTESSMGAYRLLQLTDSSNVQKVWCTKSYCHSTQDHTDTNDLAHKHLTKLPDADTDQPTDAIALSNCNTNLQFLPSGTDTPSLSSTHIEYSNRIPSLSSQLFLREITDPPQFA